MNGCKPHLRCSTFLYTSCTPVYFWPREVSPASSWITTTWGRRWLATTKTARRQSCVPRLNQVWQRQTGYVWLIDAGHIEWNFSRLKRTGRITLVWTSTVTIYRFECLFGWIRFSLNLFSSAHVSYWRRGLQPSFHEVMVSQCCILFLAVTIQTLFLQTGSNRPIFLPSLQNSPLLITGETITHNIVVNLLSKQICAGEICTTYPPVAEQIREYRRGNLPCRIRLRLAPAEGITEIECGPTRNSGKVLDSLPTGYFSVA